MKEQLKNLLAPYKGDRSKLILILQKVQGEFGHIPKEAMHLIADELEIPDSEVYGVVTFYNQFRLSPLGKHPIKVCMGTACHLAGGELVLKAAERKLEIEIGGITPDGRFSLERVACVGCCALAPVMLIGEVVRPKMAPVKVAEVIESFEQ